MRVPLNKHFMLFYDYCHCVTSVGSSQKPDFACIFISDPYGYDNDFFELGETFKNASEKEYKVHNF